MLFLDRLMTCKQFSIFTVFLFVRKIRLSCLHYGRLKQAYLQRLHQISFLSYIVSSGLSIFSFLKAVAMP